MRQRLAEWAHIAKRDVLALCLAARDPRVPPAVKLLAAMTAAYALSPIDLIPDFIPAIGYLDDLVLLPLMMLLVVRLIRKDVMAALRAEAETRLARKAPRSMAAAAIVVLWVALPAALMLILIAATAGEG